MEKIKKDQAAFREAREIILSLAKVIAECNSHFYLLKNDGDKLRRQTQSRLIEILNSNGEIEFELDRHTISIAENIFLAKEAREVWRKLTKKGFSVWVLQNVCSLPACYQT